MKYEEEQVGYWTFLAFIPIIFIVLFIYILNIDKQTMPVPILVILIFVFLFTTSLFYKLSIKLDNEYLIISFGIGLIKKKIKISDIKDVKKIKTKWHNGWGIRIIKNGILYNIQGLDAVELTFKGKKSIIQIGTKSNSNLDREINKRINIVN